MTGVVTTKIKADAIKIGDLIKKKIGDKEIILGVLKVEKSNPGERDFKLTVTDSQIMKAPHSYYVFANDEWEKVGEIDVEAYWQEFNSKKAVELPFDQKRHDYLAEYSKRVSVLQQLTLAENDARIQSYRTRDWWGNPLTSEDRTEHLWNLYQREESLNYKHFYLKMFAQRKGFKLPKYDRDRYGFPQFSEEQIKELEALHND